MKKNLILRATAIFFFTSLTLYSGESTAPIQKTGPGTGKPTSSGNSVDALAKQLVNPVSSLISVPFQNNLDFGYDNDGWQYKMNFQPVLPISLNEEWNLIGRAILPFIHQENVIGNSSQTGLSDTVASLFFSPAATADSGIIWGAGPVLLLPTATDDLLGSEKWGAGPTFVVLVQQGPWTYGMLANHIWSYAGDSGRQKVDATFLQPFLAWGGLGHGQTIALESESTYDWENEQWTVPFNLMYSKVFSVGRQMMQFQLGGRAYAEAPSGGPEWGLRATLTFLFPE